MSLFNAPQQFDHLKIELKVNIKTHVPTYIDYIYLSYQL